MSLTLGIDVGELVLAALAVSDDLGATRVLELGEGRAGIAAAVGAAPDKTVLVGDAALAAQGTVITDPLLRVRKGRRGALEAVIAHVVAKAVADGSQPERVGVVVPDDFDAAERSGVVAAANSAGMTAVTTVPRSAALSRGSALAIADELTQAACGAAAIAAVDAVPILTREDVGGPVELPAPSATGDSEMAPLREAPHRSASRPSAPAEPDATLVAAGRAHGAAQRPGPAAPAQPSVQPRPAMAPAPAASAVSDLPLRQIALGGLLAVVVLAVAGIVLLSGGNGDDSQAEVSEALGDGAEADATAEEPAAASSAPPAPAESDAPAAGTPSTSSSTTSSSTTSSSTSTTSTTSSTTVPETPAGPESLVLLDSGLRFAAGGFSGFGSDATALLDAATAALGAADYDSGLLADSNCLGTRSRFVRFGGLELVFTETAETPGTALFSQWHLSGDGAAGFTAPDGLSLGTSVGALKAGFGDDLSLVAAFEGEDLGVFSVVNPANGSAVYGLTDALDAEGVVIELWAGEGCTRVFT